MKKYEIEEKIRLHEIRIVELQAELAEKPKLGHGDFGVDKRGELRVAMNDWTNNLSSVGSASFAIDAEYGRNALPEIIFGNIFKMMEGWGEELTHFKLDVHEYKIDTREFAHAPVHIAGNWHTEAEAYKFWCDFGQMLMSLKRKQGD